MHSQKLLKLSSLIVVAAMLVVSAFTLFDVQDVQAGPMQTATVEATAQATTEATAEPTQQATPAAAATLYPPCPPPAGVEYTPEATATAPATAAATLPAEFTPGYLGIGGESVGNCGTRVTELVAGAPAERAGIRVGDVIVAADGVAYRSLATLRAYITSRAPGDRVELVLKRGEEELVIRVTLGQRPRRTPPTAAPEATAAPTVEPTTEPTAEATPEATPAATEEATPSR